MKTTLKNLSNLKIIVEGEKKHQRGNNNKLTTTIEEDSGERRKTNKLGDFVFGFQYTPAFVTRGFLKYSTKSNFNRPLLKSNIASLR